MTTLRKISLTILLLVSLVSVVLWLFAVGIVRMNYPSLTEYPVQGIDVSHHQGKIDWQTVALDPQVKFAFIKSTEGGDFKDSRFKENWEGAGRAGLKRGAYHFFTLCRSGKDQAVNVLSVVPPNSELPLAVDLEFGGNCPARPSFSALLAEIDDFMSEIRKINRAKPIFYVTPEFYDTYFKGNVAKLPMHYLWVRSIFEEPAQKNCEKWSFWQFANRGHVKGIVGPVDLNVLCPDSRNLMSSFLAR